MRESRQEQFLQHSTEPVLWIKSSSLSQTTGAQTPSHSLSLSVFLCGVHCHRRQCGHGTVSSSVCLSFTPSIIISLCFIPHSSLTFSYHLPHFIFPSISCFFLLSSISLPLPLFFLLSQIQSSNVYLEELAASISC